MRLVALLLIGGCVLGDGRAPEPPPVPDCPSLDEALVETRRALDDGGLRPIGLIVEDLLVGGVVSPELAALLGDASALDGRVGGNRLRGAVRSAMALLRGDPPTATLGLVRALAGSAEDQAGTLQTLVEFLLADPGRLRVVDPLRESLTTCGEGRPWALVLADASGARLSCGLALSCFAKGLADLAEDPALEQALALLSFEGSEGKEGFTLLIANLMDASSRPGFDVDQWRSLLRDLFAETLPESALQHLDGLLAAVGEFIGDDRRRAHWREVVMCTERHDPQRSVAGLVYDLLMGEQFDTVQLVGEARTSMADVDGDVLLGEINGLMSRLADEDSVRLPLNAVAEPLLTVPVATLLLETVEALMARGLIREWTNLATKGLSCEAP